MMRGGCRWRRGSRRALGRTGAIGEERWHARGVGTRVITNLQQPHTATQLDHPISQ